MVQEPETIFIVRLEAINTPMTQSNLYTFVRFGIIPTAAVDWFRRGQILPPALGSNGEEARV